MEHVVDHATPSDLEALVAILDACFSSPWTAEMMAEELERPMARVLVVRPAEGKPPIAFVDCWIVADEMHVLNVATHPDHHRRGHARRLMEAALALAQQQDLQCVTLELRESNRAARRLYDALGFVPIGTRPRYYADTGEDAVVMIRRLVTRS
ncbi:MAG: ribosomal protein S18-alanine N-acetyltransferase [Myxococcota bacterium]